MSKILKLLETVLVFLALMFSITLIWYLVEACSDAGNGANLSYSAFLLYLLGYGELEVSGTYTKLIFTFIAILALALMSSVFTVNLFDWRSKLILYPEMIIQKDENEKYHAAVIVKSKHKDIYNMRFRLIVDTASGTFSEEKEVPFIRQGGTEGVCFGVEPGAVIYKYFRSLFLDDTYEPMLILTIIYTDIRSGQDYTICQKFQYTGDKKGNISMCGDEIFDVRNISPKTLALMTEHNDNKTAKNLRGYIEENIFEIDLEKANPINSDEIDLIHKVNHQKQKSVVANIHFDPAKTYRSDDFAMLCITSPFGNDWTKYYDLNCAFNFEINVSKGMCVVLELKNTKGDSIISPEPVFDGKSSYSFKMKACRKEEWKNVREICFTVFYGNMKNKTLKGSFELSKCCLEIM